MKYLGFALAIWLGACAHAFACGTDAVPSAASSLGYTCETFSYNAVAEGLGPIDVNDTGNPGKKLYVSTSWPNNIQGRWSGGAAAPASTLTIGGDGGLIFNPTDTNGDALMTCHTATAAPKYVGTVFSPGYYVRMVLNWNNSNSPSFPTAGWAEPIEFLSGATAGPYVEIDNVEGNTTNSRHTFHLIATSGAGQQWSQENDFNVAGIGSGPTTTYAYDFAVIPTTQNGGSPLTGIEQRYLNDVLDSTSVLQYTFGGPATGNGSTSNIVTVTGSADPNGAYSTLDTQKYCLIVDTAPSNPITIYALQVFQRPRTPNFMSVH